jgi:hypothetical protein
MIFSRLFLFIFKQLKIFSKKEYFFFDNKSLCFRCGFLGCDLVFLHRAHEALLLLGSLESTVAELRRRVNELERDLLERNTLRLRQQRLAQRDRTFACSHYATLEHEEVLLDNTIAWETTLLIDDNEIIINLLNTHTTNHIKKI